MDSLRLLPWRAYIWIAGTPLRVSEWQKRQQSKIEPERFNKRQKIGKRIYIACFAVMAICGTLWLLTGGSNAPSSASS